jgi:hypothetical protein
VIEEKRPLVRCYSEQGAADIPAGLKSSEKERASDPVANADGCR